ncbi:MAG: TMEM175 family protein [Succinivibrio sp.]|jgi:uncharacterized membrane protein|nr:TMEM175 family protein [Succinivibrio sp.]
MIAKDRLAAISDGIIAVAATVMALQLKIPERFSFAEISSQGPVLIACAVSYAQVFLAWHEHHDALNGVREVSHRAFLLNTLWLFFITLLPFAAGCAGRDPQSLEAELLFLGLLALITLTLMLECRLIYGKDLSRMTDSTLIGIIHKISLSGIALAAAATFAWPPAGLITAMIFALFCIVLLWGSESRRKEERRQAAAQKKGA